MQMSEVVRWRIRHVGGTGDDLSTPPSSSSSSSSAAVRETSLVCRVGALRSGFCGSPSLRSLSDATLMRYCMWLLFACSPTSTIYAMSH